MPTNEVKASVILPIYNGEAYLKQAIDSVLNQTFKDFELLLLNDGSTDSSEEIIDVYLKKDKRCKKFSWQNQGLIKTLNTGIEKAQGEIIFRMDADDICHPERFEKQFQYLESHPDCVALGSRVLLIDEDGMPIKVFSVPIDHEEIDRENFRGGGAAIVHPSVVMRKDALINTGGYRDKYIHAEDIDLFLRLAEQGTIKNLSDILLEYRQHSLSIGYAKRNEQINSIRTAIKDTRLRRGIVLKSNIINEPLIETDQAQIYRKWAWWALQGGNKKTARKYLLKVLYANPFNKKNIKLFLCVMRGY